MNDMNGTRFFQKLKIIGEHKLIEVHTYMQLCSATEQVCGLFDHMHISYQVSHSFISEFAAQIIQNGCFNGTY